MALVREHDEPHSRRDRPAKPPLSRAAITDAALELVREQGLDAVTLRKVADRLDTGPASLYVYVPNRDALLERMLETVLAEVPLMRVGRKKWQPRLTELFRGMLNTLNQYPGIATVGLGSSPVGPGARGITENALALMNAGGVSTRTAACAYDALRLFTLAHAIEYAIELRRGPVEDGDDHLERFEFGLNALVRGARDG
jgi:AcrR family transcriptional regulator